MALYHEFGGADWARVMWDNWSKQSETYKAGATEAKWETFQKNNGPSAKSASFRPSFSDF